MRRTARLLRAAAAPLALTLGALATSSTSVASQERILSYDIEVEIARDGTLDVTERIRVRAEGARIRRGIYRDFPTRYRDGFGNRMRVGFQVVGVERNGATEPWFTERLSNGVRINTGNDDLLQVPAEHDLTLRYRTTRQLGFFPDHDELYWNAVGTGWDFAIEEASIVVHLPDDVAADQMTVEAYTGRQGARGTNYTAEVTGPGEARFATTRPLQPREGFTIVVTFPKGVVTEPTRAQELRLFFSDNRGVFVAIVGLVALLVFCVREWRRVGRDPAPGVIFPRYEPKEGFTPSAHRYLGRMGYDTLCFSGDVLALAVSGHLRIDRDDNWLVKDDWTLRRLRGPSSELPESQRILLSELFPGADQTLELKNSNAQTLMKAHSAHKRSIDRALHPRYFKRNGSSIAKAVAIGVGSAVVAFVISGGFGTAAIVASTLMMLLVIAVFSYLVKAPTPEGREAMDEIGGFRLYLSVAEGDELATLRGPQGKPEAANAGPPETPPALDAGRYEELLPYAVALEVEDAWTDKFTAAVGAAAAAQAASHVTWYTGSGPITDMGSFTSAIGSSLSSTISSASSPPGSSSGSGGGGFSGGGGGGGGGGGR